MLLDQKILDLIKEEAAKPTPEDDDDFMVDDHAGGNIDDAFAIGCEAGSISFARFLLSKIEDKGD